MAEKWFWFVWAITLAYVIIGNHLYRGRVLRALNEPPHLLPSAQLAQVDRYLRMLDDIQKQTLSARVLRNVRAITAFVAILVLSEFAAVFIR